MPTASSSGGGSLHFGSSSKSFRDRCPQKSLALTLDPDAVLGYGNNVGNAIDVDYDFPPYHRIDAVFFVTGQRFYPDDAGNFLCDLSLDQIYQGPC